MKVFFCAHDVVEYDGTSYFSNPISYMVNRYGEEEDTVICYAPIIHVSKPHSQKILKKNTQFIDAPRIDSIKQIPLIKRYLNEMKSLLNSCDFAVIHIHVYLINYICVLAAKKVNLPFMTVIVGCAWDALWNHSFKGKLFAPLCFFLEKWALRISSYSIYVTKQFLQNRYPTKGKWIACSNVELDFKGNPIPRTIKKENEIINIATVAALNVKYKGQQYVIKALAKLRHSNKQYRYHLVGAGDFSYLKKLVYKYNVSDMVIFHGPMLHDEIASFLDGIDIYVQPSKQEGLPRSVIEAMSRGCLCIGSNIAGIPELIDSQYLFKAGDSTEIARILESIGKEDIICQGKLNMDRAKDYSKKVLDNKRNIFIKNFRKNIYHESTTCR